MARAQVFIRATEILQPPIPFGKHPPPFTSAGTPTPRTPGTAGGTPTNKQWTVKCEKSLQRGDVEHEFDGVFNSSANNSDIFGAVSGHVKGVLDGVNFTALAYGQTGSGKTHTMLGSDADLGITPRAIECLYAEMARRPDELVSVQFSMCEILKNKCRNLLKEGAEDGEEIALLSAAHARELLAVGNSRRTVGATGANKVSSRAHMIVALRVTCTQATIGRERCAQLTLVDLAGSEAHDPSCPDRAEEGTAIRTSLSSLSRVLMNLADKHRATFRECTLTHKLKPALDGNSRTAVICTVLLAPTQATETTATLNFARSAMRVPEHARVNETTNPFGSKAHVEQLLCENELLRGQVALLRREAAQRGSQPPERSSNDLLEQFSQVLTEIGGEPSAGAAEPQPTQEPVRAREAELAAELAAAEAAVRSATARADAADAEASAARAAADGWKQAADVRSAEIVNLIARLNHAECARAEADEAACRKAAHLQAVQQEQERRHLQRQAEADAALRLANAEYLAAHQGAARAAVEKEALLSSLSAADAAICAFVARSEAAIGAADMLAEAEAACAELRAEAASALAHAAAREAAAQVEAQAARAEADSAVAHAAAQAAAVQAQAEVDRQHRASLHQLLAALDAANARADASDAARSRADAECHEARQNEALLEKALVAQAVVLSRVPLSVPPSTQEAALLAVEGKRPPLQRASGSRSGVRRAAPAKAAAKPAADKENSGANDPALQLPSWQGASASGDEPCGSAPKESVEEDIVEGANCRCFDRKHGYFDGKVTGKNTDCDAPIKKCFKCKEDSVWLVKLSGTSAEVDDGPDRTKLIDEIYHFCEEHVRGCIKEHKRHVDQEAKRKPPPERDEELGLRRSTRGPGSRPSSRPVSRANSRAASPV